MELKGMYRSVCAELLDTLEKIEESQADALIAALLGAERVFVAGAGRSGLIVRSFAMRLMHMGFTAFVVGDATTPAIRRGDLLLVASGSGETESLVSMAKKAKALEAKVALVTIRQGSGIGKLADAVVAVQAPAKADGQGGSCSIQPMGSLFEQYMFLFFDCITLQIMERRGIGADDMFALHANLE